MDVLAIWKDVINFLQTAGPWALVVTLAWTTRYLFITREKERGVVGADKQALNDRLISMAEKQNDVLEKAASNQALLLEAVKRSGGDR
jgi:hypothetical protein